MGPPMSGRRLIPILAFAAALCGVAHAQLTEVQAQIEVVHPGNRKASQHDASSNVVVWLKPVGTGDAAPVDLAPPGRFRMAQKNKMFQPHLLVVPLGSTVAFPNLDPFFHNVFSQFNGKRFDLGLYEAGSTKDVRFNHEGISYIFCNIHPEMSAVIITLATPWYASAAGSHAVTLHDVPAGTYSLHVWAEGADTRQLESLTRTVRVRGAQSDLGVIRIVTGELPPTHRNKFGEDYRPDPDSTYSR
jgi:plastocyanin